MSESQLPSRDSGSQSELRNNYTSCLVKIGGYCVDFDERTVTTPEGEVRNISPSSIKLLNFLLQHTNSYVSLQEVHDVVYGHQYKDDSSSRKQVTVLRKLFDDNDKEKRFIENRPGHGYRLIAPVQIEKKEFIQLEEPASQDDEGLAKKKQGSWYLTAIAASVIVLTGVLAGIWWSQKKVKVLSPDKVQSLTHLRGIESYPEFSRDGKWMLFDFEHQDRRFWQIHLRDMETGELIPLGPSSINTRMPRWSRDGHYITYSQFNDDKCQFMMAEFDSQRIKLINEQEVAQCSVYSISNHSELWPDNKGIFFNRADTVNAPFIIYSHQFGDSNDWPIAVPPPSGKGDYYFDVNEDGTRLAVLRNKNLSSTEIWIYDTKSRETRLVDTIDLILFSVKWGRDQRSIVYQNQFNQIVSLDINKNVKTVLFESEIPFDTPVPFDSGMAFRTGATKNRDLEKINLVEGTRELYESSSYRDTLPAISPQGNKVAWVSNRSGLYQVWYKEEDGIPHQITHIKNQIQFEGLTFNIDGTKLGGTASGRWFVIDLKDFSITWSSSNSYFTNFSWTRESGVAYVLMKDVERSELLRLNTQTLEMLPSELPKDAFIAMDDYNSEVTFYATLSKKGFWRITKSGNQKVSHYFNIPVVVNHTLMWSSTIKGLYYSWEGQLYFLDHSSETIEMVDSINDITYFSMPINAYWLLNIKVTQSDTDIKFIE